MPKSTMIQVFPPFAGLTLVRCCPPPSSSQDVALDTALRIQTCHERTFSSCQVAISFTLDALNDLYAG